MKRFRLSLALALSLFAFAAPAAASAAPVDQASWNARKRHIALPNGVRLELDDADAQVLAAMIEALGRCHVPAR